MFFLCPWVVIKVFPAYEEFIIFLKLVIIKRTSIGCSCFRNGSPDKRSPSIWGDCVDSVELCIEWDAVWGDWRDVTDVYLKIDNNSNSQIFSCKLWLDMGDCNKVLFVTSNWWPWPCKCCTPVPYCFSTSSLEAPSALITLKQCTKMMALCTLVAIYALS